MIFRTTLFIFLFLPFASVCQEICDNGIDDDNDGLIDLNDSDCQCLDILDDLLYLSNGDFAASPMCCVENNFSKDVCLDDWVPINGSPEYIDPDCYEDLPEEEESIGIPIDNEFIGLKYNDFSSFVFKETFGICTNEELEKDIKYRLEFDIRFTDKDEHNSGQGSPQLVFYGLKACSELVFTDATSGELCELGFELYALDSLSFSEISYTKWESVKKTFSAPENINAIIIGYDCNASVYSLKRFLFLDNIKISRLLNQQFDFNLEIESIGNLCDDDFSLSTTEVSGFDYQWYKDGIAVVGEKGNILEIENGPNGQYQLALSNPDGCVVTEQIEVSAIDIDVDTTICYGTSLDITTGSFDDPGIYTENIPSELGCETYIYNLDIEDIIIGDTVVESFQKGSIYSFAGQQYDSTGTYDIVLETSLGCDSMITLVLAEIDFTIRIPNVFDPNLSNDDQLTVYIDKASVEIINQFSIYDRWGNLIFSQSGIAPNLPELGWDGRINNRASAPGVYIVYVQATFNDGEIKEKWSSINLVN